MIDRILSLGEFALLISPSIRQRTNFCCSFNRGFLFAYWESYEISIQNKIQSSKFVFEQRWMANVLYHFLKVLFYLFIYFLSFFEFFFLTQIPFPHQCDLGYIGKRDTTLEFLKPLLTMGRAAGRNSNSQHETKGDYTLFSWRSATCYCHFYPGTFSKIYIVWEIRCVTNLKIKGAIKLMDWMGLKTVARLEMATFNQVNGFPILSRLYVWIVHFKRYTFKNKALLIEALTHASYIPNRITNYYQRLEFLDHDVPGTWVFHKRNDSNHSFFFPSWFAD